jgi:DNA-binding MarR family transcriptional regulator
MLLIMYHDYMARKARQQPETVVEQAMVAIRRRQSRRSLARRAERDHGLAVSAAVTEVLDIVEANDDSAPQTTVTSLGRHLGLDQPRASKLAGQAIAAGLLRRVADQHDGRRSLLELTADGRAYLERVHHYRRGQFARAMSGWTDQERETFADLLTRFITALGQPDTGGPDRPHGERAAAAPAPGGPEPRSPQARQPPPDPARP